MKLCVINLCAGVLVLSAHAEEPLKTTPVAPVKTATKIAQAPMKAAPGKLDSETRVILKSITARYQKLGNWKAEFAQETTSVGLGRTTYAQGQFLFVGPDKFRYSVLSPDPSDFISDGKHAWQIVYTQGRGQAADVKTFKDLKALELDRYLLLLRGIDVSTPKAEAALLEEFTVKGKSEDGQLMIELEPKKSSDIVRVQLAFKNELATPSKAILEDALGTKTVVTIGTTGKVSAADVKLLKPEIPKGSKIENL